MTFPFRIFSNQNLGTQYDYTTFTGEWLPSKGTGQLPVLPEINLATGNVILKSPSVKTQEKIGDWKFAFVYNAQNTTPWCINVPGIVVSKTTASSLSFRESDGSEVVYTLDPATNTYLSPQGGESKFQITKLADNSFIQLNPKTGKRTLFDVNGNITAVYDARGNAMQYGYVNGELNSISSSAGEYSITQNNNVTTLSFLETGKTQSEMLGVWTFDAQSRLQSATIPGAQNYVVSYQYENNSNQLIGVTQTDGTSVSFDYSKDNAAKLNAIKIGDTGPQYHFDYRGDVITITDALGFETTVTLDEQDRILSWEQAVSDIKKITTSCNYDDKDNLKNIIKPNGAETQFAFNSQGLMTKRVEANGQTTEFDYDQTGFYRTIKRELTENNNYAVTRYVYRDPARAVNNLSCRDLAFVISPTGSVTEYRYDDNGVRASERIYLKNSYDLSVLANDKTVAYSDMETWVSQQPADQIRLTTFAENARGQKTDIQKFSEINPDGTGKITLSASHDQFTDHTRWGAAQTHVQKINADQTGKEVTAETKKQYDQLQRLISRENAKGQTRSFAYQDANQCMVITEPNNRTETHKWNNAGQLQTVTTTVDSVSREKRLQYDKAGRVSVITDSAGLSTYQVFDALNRLRSTVSPEGYVTENTYDDENRYQSETRYFNPIAMTSLVLPLTADWLNSQLTKDATKDVTTYKITDKSGRLQFEIDGRGAIIEHRYDLRNQEIVTIAYDAFLTSDELTALKHGNLNRTPSASKDRIHLQFYDADSHVIATQDAMGYVTSFIRNPAGDVMYERKYAAASSLMLDGILNLPAQSAKDYAKYDYRDAKGNLLCTVDDVVNANYVVSQTFLPTGDVKTKTQFANTAPVAPTLNSNSASLLPAVNSEDQVTQNEYDELRRLIRQHLPSMRLREIAYDDMGHEIENSLGDDALQLPAGAVIETRGSAKRYDAWGQLIAEVTPLVYDKIQGILNDKSMSADQQSAQIEVIWRNQSRRFEYDAVTGLLTAKKDIVADDGDINNPPKTVYFYDKDRRQILSIGPEGQAKTTQWHAAFDKPVQEHCYATAVDSTQLPQQNNGLITANVTALLNPDADNDVVDQHTYDGGGAEVNHVDPDGYQTTAKINAFGQWYEKALPIHDKNPTLTLARQFNLRGQTTGEAKTTSTGKTITTNREYKNLHGQCTKIIDENNAVTTMTHEPRGTLSTSTNALNQTTTFEHDAFDRETKRILPTQNVIAHDYIQANRKAVETQVDSSGAALASQTQTLNAFDQVIIHEDAKGNKTTQEYNAAGDWELKTDALGNTTTRKHDLRGLLRKRKYQSALNSFSRLDQYDYSPGGEKLVEIQDAENLALKTQYQWNPLHQQTGMVTASNRKRKTIFNKRSLATAHHKICDDQTVLVTAQEYNGKGEVSALARSTESQSASVSVPTESYQEKVVHDDYGRAYQTIIDPANLKLTTTTSLDNANRVIAKTDANKQTTYFVRDVLGNIRFEINPAGGVTEHRYNAANKPVFTVQYQTAVDITKIDIGMNDDAIAALLSTSDYDRHTHYFYDALNNERFRVNRAGAVVENKYDANNQKIATIQYYRPVTDATLALSTASLTAFYQTNCDDTRDKAAYRVLDAAGQEVFIVDADGSVTQKIYASTLHQVNTEIKFANRIANPKQVLTLSLSEITALLTPCKDDRQTNWYYDALNRLQFHVNAKGAVTKYDYDGDTKNRVKITEFAKPVLINTSHQDLLKLVADSSVDNIETQQFDAAERLITRTNALGVSETFTYDGAGRENSHTTLSNHKWTYEYDGANRLSQETSPLTTFYQASIVSNNVTEIKVTSTNASVVKKTDYDGNSNVMGIHSGVGLDDERVVNFIYSALDQKTQDIWSGLPIDDPSQQTSLTVLPEIKQEVAKKVLYGAHGEKLVSLDEASQPMFFVYNAQNQLKYRVNAKGYVIEYQRNVFGECEKMIAYATALSVTNLKQYASTGLSADFVAQYIVKNEKADHHYYQQFNQKGELVQLKRDSVVCYIPNSTPSLQTPTKNYQYNTFGEVTCVETVVDQANNVSDRVLTWHDGLGNVMATVDSNGKAILKLHDSFGREIETIRYAKFIPSESMPTKDTTFDQLRDILATLKNPAKDHHTQTPRDQLGRIKGIYHVGLVTQQIVAAQQDFIDNPAATIGVTYTYTKDNKIKTITFPDGQVKIRYYDERRFLVAEADVVRTQQPSGQKIRPITYYHVSAHGERVETYQPESGCAVVLDPASEIVPQPLQSSDQDKYFRFMRDARSHILVKQDPENNLEQMTVTATGKIARQYHQVTNPEKTHLDETQKTYDELDRLSLVAVLRDAQLQHKIAYDHDAFHLIAEGPGDNTWPAQHRYDQVGRKWLTVNSKGGTQIIGHNAAGDETVNIESTTLTNDLSKIADQDALLALLQKRSDVVNAEFLETVRDAGRRPTAFVEPGYVDENGATVRPTFQLGLDAFDKKVQSITPKGEVTTFERNLLNKVIKQTDPAIDVVDEKGVKTVVQPVTQTGYNNQGEKIGVKDANGHTEILIPDEAGKVVTHTAGDGVAYFTNTNDVFGRAVAVTSATGGVYQKKYDRKDNVTMTTLPSGDAWKFQSNENNFVTKVTPPTGSAQGETQYAQGPYGDMSTHYLPMGEKHEYTHDRHHGELSHCAINMDGSVAYQTLSTRDFFGKILTHTDGSGSQYQNNYYLNGMLYQELGLSVTGHGQMAVFDSTTQTFPQNSYVPMELKNITYRYLTRLRQNIIEDNNKVAPQKLVRIFDLNRNIPRVTETNGAGRLLRDTQMTFNACQLPVAHTDLDGFSVDYFYDPTFNRRRMLATYSGITHDAWWTYDNTNRVLVNDGQMINGVIQSVFAGNFGYLAPSQGNTFTYQKGLRETQALYLLDSLGSYSNSNPVSAALSYDVNDRVASIATWAYGVSQPSGVQSVFGLPVVATNQVDVRPFPGIINGSRLIGRWGDINPKYDSADFTWDVNVLPGETIENTIMVAIGNSQVIPAEICIANGNFAGRFDQNLVPNTSYVFFLSINIEGTVYQTLLQGTSFYCYPVGVQYTPDGLFSNSFHDFVDAGKFILNQQSYNANGLANNFYSETFNGQTVLAYSGFNVDCLSVGSRCSITSESYIESWNHDLAYWHYNTGSVVTDLITNQFYLFDSTVLSSTAATRTDQYGTSDLVTSQRYYDSNAALSVVDNVVNPFNPNQQSPEKLFFVNSLDGRMLAEWGVSYPDAHGGSEGIDGPTRFFHDTKGRIAVTHGTVVNGKQESEKVLQITANPVHSFRMSDLLNGANSLVIQPGDTWASLSNRAFRDPNYADILHAYSGMPLIPGQTINLMQTLNAYNKAKDFRPYEKLMSAIYNSMNSAVKTPQPPPPPPPHHESFWDELIGAVIAVVVMIVAPEAVGFLAFGAAFSSAGLAALTAGQAALAFAVGGALADAATQGVAIAFDDQHGFSVQSMVENAVVAGATAGLTKALNIEGLLTEKNPEYCLAFAESVGVGMTVQLFQISLGLRDKLDIKFILEQAAATVLQAKINRGLPKAPKPLTDLVDEFENTGVSAAFTGKVDLTALAGNTLGDEAADTADLIASHVRQSHHTTSIGKSSKPSDYSAHAHAHHTDSHYTPDAVQQDDGIGDLYNAYKSGLQGDVNAMAESQFNSALSSHQHDPEISYPAPQNSHSDTGFENWLSHEVYDHQHSLWARGIMGFAGIMNSNTMHIALNGANTFTRDLMGDVAGSYGTRYFDDLQNGRSTFSDAMNFVGAELDVQALGEVGGVALGYATRFAGEVLPNVSRNMQGLFRSGEVEKSAHVGTRLRVLANIVETRSGINASNFGVHAALEKIPFLDISTGLDEATFWSGRGNRSLAESFANLGAKRTIEMTPGGQYLESLKLFDRFPRAQAIIPWERLSLRFAQNASGTVSAFVEGAASEGVFTRIEYPALLNNPKITGIEYSPVYENKNIYR